MLIIRCRRTVLEVSHDVPAIFQSVKALNVTVRDSA